MKLPTVLSVLIIVTLVSRAPGVFGGQAMPLSEFLIVGSLTSCCRAEHVLQGKFELESLSVQQA